MSRANEPEDAGHRSVLRVVLGAPRPVWGLVAGVFINRTGSFFSTFLVLFLRQLGFSLSQMPVVLLVVGVATPCGAMLGGWAADRFSRRASLVGTTVLAALGMALIGLSPSRMIALAGVFVGALFSQAYLPAASAMLVDHTPERDRVPMFAFFRLALNAGAALGPVLAALLAPHGLKLLFVVSACCYLTFAVVLAVTQKAAPARASAAARSAAAAPGRAPVTMLAFYAAVLGITVVYAQYSSTVSLAVSAVHGTSIYATLLTLNAVLVIVAELPLSSWTRRLPWRTPVLAGILAMAGGIAISGAFRSYPVIALGVVIWSVGEMLFSPVVSTAVAALSPADRVGRYQGYLATVQAVAFALGPAVGVLAYSYSASVLWVGCVVVGALAGLADAFAGGRTAAAVPRPAEVRVPAGQDGGRSPELGQG